MYRLFWTFCKRVPRSQKAISVLAMLRFILVLGDATQ